MSEPVIVLDHLSKSFGSVHAVQDLSLTIAPGTIFGFLGANGAGKTTTIRMLCGLTHPTAGNATIAGTDVWKDRQRVRTKFGYVPQRFSLYRDLTVLENFRFFGGAYGVPGAELESRIEHLLRVIDLEEKKNTAAQSLSGGMRQLLAKAPPRALKSSFRTRLLEVDIEPLMPALVRLRSLPELLGVSLRSGGLRLYVSDPEKLLARWRENWPFPDLRLLGERWVEPDMEDVFTAYSQGYHGVLRKLAS